MHDPQSPRDELTGFEAQLASLTPCARLDRDRLMFAAGRNAAARPLRVANRLLATASVALATLAAFALAMPRLSNKPLDRGEPQTAAETTFTDAGTDDAPSDGVTRRSLAAIDGPTRFRLRQRFERGLDDRVTRPTERAPLVDVGPKPSPPSGTRALLKQYLNNTPDRL